MNIQKGFFKDYYLISFKGCEDIKELRVMKQFVISSDKSFELVRLTHSGFIGKEKFMVSINNLDELRTSVFYVPYEEIIFLEIKGVKEN